MKGKADFNVVWNQLKQRLVLVCSSAWVLTAFTAPVQSPLHPVPQLSQCTQTDPRLGLDFLHPRPVLSRFRFSPELLCFCSSPKSQWTKSYWLSQNCVSTSVGSLQQQDTLRGSDKQTLPPWTCQSLIPSCGDEMLVHTSTTSLSAEFSLYLRFGNRRLKTSVPDGWWIQTLLQPMCSVCKTQRHLSFAFNNA